MAKKLKQQEKVVTDESKVAMELRKRYDLQKKKLEEMQSQRDVAQKQLKQVLGVFATHKKALEMSIMKNSSDTIQIGNAFTQKSDLLKGDSILQRSIDET